MNQVKFSIRGDSLVIKPVAGERMTREQYQREVLLLPASVDVPKGKRDQRWHHELERQITLHPGISKHDFKREYLFHPTRKFRFDFCFDTRFIAVEVEGIVLDGKSRHQTFLGYTKDCVKYSEAACLGWRIIRATQEMIKSGVAIDLIERALKEQL